MFFNLNPIKKYLIMMYWKFIFKCF